MASSFGNDLLNKDKPPEIHKESEGELHNKYININHHARTSTKASGKK